MRLSGFSCLIHPFMSGFQHSDSSDTLNMNQFLCFSSWVQSCISLKKLTVNNATLLKLFCISNKYMLASRLSFCLGIFLGRELGFVLRHGWLHPFLKCPGHEQAKVKRWSFVHDPGSALCPHGSSFLSLTISCLIFLLLSALIHSVSLLPSLIALTTT